MFWITKANGTSKLPTLPFTVGTISPLTVLATPIAGASVKVTGVASLSVPSPLSPEVLLPLSESSFTSAPLGLCADATAVLLYGPRFSPGVTVNCNTMVSFAATAKLWLAAKTLVSLSPSKSALTLKVFALSELTLKVAGAGKVARKSSTICTLVSEISPIFSTTNW